MSGIATAVVAGSVISGVIGSSAASSAADTQAQAATNAANAQLQATNNSNAMQWQMYQQGLVNQSPYLQGGQEGYAALLSAMGLGVPTAGGTNTGINPGASAAAPVVGPGSQPTGTTAPPGVNATPGGGTANGAPPGMQVAAPTSGVGTNPNIPSVQGNGRGLTGMTSANGLSPIGGPGAVAPTSASGINPSAAVAAPGSAPAAGSVNIPGIGNVAPTNYGATQSQLNSAGASVTPGQLTQQFNNSDLNAQLAPNYQFQLNQGEQALKASMAATGTLQTGQGLKNINDYAQNQAAGAYQQAFSNWNTQQNNLYTRLQGVIAPGASAATSASGAAQSTGSNIAQTTMAGTSAANNYNTSAAAAGAAGTVGQANAWSNAIGSGVNGYMGANIYNKYMGTPGTPPPTTPPTQAGSAAPSIA